MALVNIFELNSTLILWQLFLALVIVVQIVSVIDVVRNKFEGNQKIVWIIVCIFAPLGGFVYFFLGKNRTVKR